MDAILMNDGEPFVLEIGPRSGGNFIPQAIKLKTGINLVEAAVEGSWNRHYKLNLQSDSPAKEPFVACYMVHSQLRGRFGKVSFSKKIAKNIVSFSPYLSSNDPVSPFVDGSCAIGNLLMRFDNFEEMKSVMSEMLFHHELEIV